MMMEILLAACSFLFFFSYSPGFSLLRTKMWRKKMNGVHSHANHLTPAPTANRIPYATQQRVPTLFIPQSSCIHDILYIHDTIRHSLIIVNAIAHCHCLHFPIKINFFLTSRPSYVTSVFSAFVPSISIIKRNQNVRAHPLRGTFAASVANSHCTRSVNIHQQCVENGFEWKWKMKMGISAINPIEIGEKYRDSFEQS